jgi:Zn-finger nucleic acid-binding protein
MRKHAKTLLYNGSTMTKLEANILLLEMKARNGMSNTGFNDVLSLMQKFVPSPNELPQNTYKVKQMICPLRLEVQKIHACTIDCILFRRDYKDLDLCPRCHASWYKTGNDAMMQASHEKRLATKVMWYFPIIPHLKCLFATAKTAKLMRWHAEDRVNDGKLQHSADVAQWRAINHSYNWSFSNEIRNIRFGLSMDGMNSFNMVSSNHSTWLVILCIYNLLLGCVWNGRTLWCR